MNGGASATIELHVQSSGRWQIHANYGLERLEDCIDSAKALYVSRRFDATRVVRETFNPADKLFHEEVLYRSPCRPKSKPKTTSKAKPKVNLKGAQARSLKPQRVRKSRGPRNAGASGAAEALPRLAIIATVSLGVAALTAFLFSVLFKSVPVLHAVLGRTGSEAVLLTSFAVSFLLIFIPLLRKVLPTLREGGAARLASPVEESTPPVIAAPEAALEITEPQEPEEPEEPEKLEEPEDTQEEEEDAAPYEEPTVTEAAAQVSTEMLHFIGDCLAPLAEAERPLDAFNRFGLTLYFCGAGEYLASQSRLSKQEIEDILCTHMQKLGHTPDMAHGFCANIDEYLVNPKYFQMYEAGRSAMARQASYPEGTLGVMEAVDAWNEPAVAESKNKKEFVAVLFTDIVGSTAMTQERGDDAAQLVVHEHNSIVREALALHGGREIKHTGDGIMATFPQVTNAVEGAVAMQQACQRSNAANPELGLGLCIGVNAGEPIHEDGDIFGTPVQMAARVLSKAEGEEIAVSNLVREMCTGKSYDFSKKGDYDLKGFPEPVPIYLVSWQGELNAPEQTEESNSEAGTN